MFLSGRRAYDFTVSNFFYAALPSAQSLYRNMLRQSTITECGFTLARFQAAPAFFASVGYTSPFVMCSNDATALKPELAWRPSDNALLGFVVDDAELPVTLFTAGTKVSQIQTLIDTYKLSTQLEVYLINPLDPRIPSYVLAAFADQHRAGVVHAARWRTIDELLSRHGLHVISHSCDGDPAHLSTQLARAAGTGQLPCVAGAQPRRFSFHGAILINGTPTTVSTSSRDVVVNGATIQMPLLHFQDMEHTGLKIK